MDTVTDVPILDQLPVLADPTRVRMLAVLERHELTVGELCDVLQLPQSTVSRHLKTLADAGWLAPRREGTSRLYRVTLDDIAPTARRLWLLVREQVDGAPAAFEDERRLKEVLARRRTRAEEFFASAAGQWDRLREELFGPATPLRALLGLLDPEWSVGDLGCGTGQVAETLAPFVRRVLAVDGSPEMLEAAGHRLQGHDNVELRRGALEQLPLADGELDAACLVLVLHYVADPARVLAETRRALRPGGRILVVDMAPHAHEEYRQTMGHVWLGFDEMQATRLLGDAGFTRLHWKALAPDPRAKGPSLFLATGRCC